MKTAHNKTRARSSRVFALHSSLRCCHSTATARPPLGRQPRGGGHKWMTTRLPLPAQDGEGDGGKESGREGGGKSDAEAGGKAGPKKGSREDIYDYKDDFIDDEGAPTRSRGCGSYGRSRHQLHFRCCSSCCSWHGFLLPTAAAAADAGLLPGRPSSPSPEFFELLHHDKRKPKHAGFFITKVRSMNQPTNQSLFDCSLCTHQCSHGSNNRLIACRLSARSQQRSHRAAPGMCVPKHPWIPPACPRRPSAPCLICRHPAVRCFPRPPRLQGEIEKTDEIMPGFEELEKEKKRGQGGKRKAAEEAESDERGDGGAPAAKARGGGGGRGRGVQGEGCRGVVSSSALLPAVARRKIATAACNTSLPACLPACRHPSDTPRPSRLVLPSQEARAGGGEKKKRKAAESGGEGGEPGDKPAAKKKKKAAGGLFFRAGTALPSLIRAVAEGRTCCPCCTLLHRLHPPLDVASMRRPPLLHQAAARPRAPPSAPPTRQLQRSALLCPPTPGCPSLSWHAWRAQRRQPAALCRPWWRCRLPVRRVRQRRRRRLWAARRCRRGRRWRAAPAGSWPLPPPRRRVRVGGRGHCVDALPWLDRQM